ncbi:DAK2 domain-containing protein [Actinoplanes sp. NEAU-A12]|uniref:DAK2 domain-containing protein n=1 Tax=Actinoplanes sandaracinus TaxID=3045177 RepID=A0ABT6WD83_9ACTN|nr:DAK2 domain-containing protein [Actinoplanes sandaracinus]MDI6097680.1 DAK2 domain-containing protein [Actinoplanes sandaracinus]
MLETLDAAAVRRWCDGGLEALRAHQREIDDLNVYPVPDGDTGTNLVLTLTAAHEALASTETLDPTGAHGPPGSTGVAGLMRRMARGALLGARGNSGVIVSQILRGMADTFTGTVAVRGIELARALRTATDAAYAAVARPVEGTVLSVVAAAAEGAGRIKSDDLLIVARAAARAATEALARTPQQLPILAQAGVVDAGGRGLCLLLDALVRAVADGSGEGPGVGERSGDGERSGSGEGPGVGERSGSGEGNGDASADTTSNGSADDGSADGARGGDASGGGSGSVRGGVGGGSAGGSNAAGGTARRATAGGLVPRRSESSATADDGRPESQRPSWPGDRRAADGRPQELWAAGDQRAPGGHAPDGGYAGAGQAGGGHTGAGHAGGGHVGGGGEDGCAGFGYEVQYLLDATDEAVERLRTVLDGLGDSLVIVGSGDGDPPTWNVHVHVTEIGPAVEAGIAAGRPYRISVTPLEERRGGSDSRGAVVVAAGDGLTALFEAEGVVVVDRNPSTAEMLAAVHATCARSVVLLPNDANTHAVAVSAAREAETTGVRVSVVPTRSPVQALAALAVRDAQRPFADDVIAMAEAAGACRYGEVCTAQRDAFTVAGQCRAGDLLGLVDGEVHVIGSDLAEVSRRLLDRMLGGGGELVTLVLGAGVPSGFEADLRGHVHRTWPFIELECYAGGQPRYHLLAGVE